MWQWIFGRFWGSPVDTVSTGVYLFFVILSPIFALIGLFIAAGVYHLGLLITDGGKRGFGVTLRAVCYGYTPGLLGVVPICGGIVGGLWVLVLTILGAMYGHRTEPWRAILGYFLPLIACCALWMGLVMMFGFLEAS